MSNARDVTPTLHHVTCPDADGGHRMAYWQWGRADAAHVVLCVHGLSRQGRDFDALAEAICADAGRLGHAVRVVCPDVAGRGQSDWLKDPTGYQIPNYAADMLALVAHLHADAPITVLDWVGTSMGGLIGIVVCGQPGLPLPVKVRKLLLNDVGPTLEWDALVRIGTYLGQAGEFASLQAAADAMWTISSSFGPHTPDQWLALSRAMVVPVTAGTDGPLRLHYDPAIAVPFRQSSAQATRQGEAVLWQLYDAITADTLVTRGELSDLLSKATAAAMAERGPKAAVVEFEGVGHAPTFVDPAQSAVVAGFVLAGVQTPDLSFETAAP